ncbi:MAG: 7-cyano-7-deazaguanine synthase [Phormidesmis sp.]
MRDISPANDYTLIFSAIQNENGFVRFTNEANGEEERIGISIDDRAFQCRVQKEFPSMVADLVDIAVAVHASDRLTEQPLDENQTCIRVVLPVRNPDSLNDSDVAENLSRLLYWATGSRWIFEFQKRTEIGRAVERQSLLLSTDPHVDEVALWSGGLDALAGVYNRLQQHDSRKFMLFGTGSSDNVCARQKNVFKRVRTAFPDRVSLCQVPLRFSDSEAHRKNKFSRARGVVFTLLGSAYAYLMGRNVLHLYENGIGAINLPYRKSAIGLDHSRSVHPLSLLQVGTTVSAILNESFEVCNPFLFWTKGEMCQALAHENGRSLILSTTSCDSPHRKKNIQSCGYCSSCLLRKQSIAVSKIEDPSHYIVPHGEPPVEDTELHLRHMLAQVSIIKKLLSSEKGFSAQWQALTQRFPELDDISDRLGANHASAVFSTRRKLLRLYQTYVSEWDAVESQLVLNILSKTTEQHPLDEPLVSHQ